MNPPKIQNAVLFLPLLPRQGFTYNFIHYIKCTCKGLKQAFKSFSDIDLLQNKKIFPAPSSFSLKIYFVVAII